MSSFSPIVFIVLMSSVSCSYSQYSQKNDTSGVTSETNVELDALIQGERQATGLSTDPIGFAQKKTNDTKIKDEYFRSTKDLTPVKSDKETDDRGREEDIESGNVFSVNDNQFDLIAGKLDAVIENTKKGVYDIIVVLVPLFTFVLGYFIKYFQENIRERNSRKLRRKEIIILYASTINYVTNLIEFIHRDINDFSPHPIYKQHILEGEFLGHIDVVSDILKDKNESLFGEDAPPISIKESMSVIKRKYKECNEKGASYMNSIGEAKFTLQQKLSEFRKTFAGDPPKPVPETVEKLFSETLDYTDGGRDFVPDNILRLFLDPIIQWLDSEPIRSHANYPALKDAMNVCSDKLYDLIGKRQSFLTEAKVTVSELGNHIESLEAWIRILVRLSKK